MQLYFKDRLFSAGITEILNEQEQQVGKIDLKSAFTSAIDVYGADGRMLCKGRFPFFSNRWEVCDADERQLGVLRVRFSFLSKKFTYEAEGRGRYDLVGSFMSREYAIHDESGTELAHFRQVNGMFSSGAFRLDHTSTKLDSYELVAVIMGMYAIQKRQSSAANAGTI
ncbi:LURP-one-related/scramblase family protein [Paenibacillus aestuarii]|uniref:LURP-one-related family protein n=1 Tax=Paenibacillus aestuarii TaxID=516965 RepID=A0ABW0K759_9BACL|nr:hypothetical protein [Paenibacillus aestuarii]